MRSKPGASTVFATSQYPGPGFELLNGFLSPATPKHIFSRILSVKRTQILDLDRML